jgi:hypothetical protein
VRLHWNRSRYQFAGNVISDEKVPLRSSSFASVEIAFPSQFYYSPSARVEAKLKTLAHGLNREPES